MAGFIKGFRGAAFRRRLCCFHPLVRWPFALGAAFAGAVAACPSLCAFVLCLNPTIKFSLVFYSIRAKAKRPHPRLPIVPLVCRSARCCSTPSHQSATPPSSSIRRRSSCCMISTSARIVRRSSFSSFGCTSRFRSKLAFLGATLASSSCLFCSAGVARGRVGVAIGGVSANLCGKAWQCVLRACWPS